MANGLKYWAEFKNTRGHIYRLDIYRRGYTGDAKEIKTLCGCVLEIQGAQNDIIAPIIKTQLRFAVIDAWDIADTADAKWGSWSEFYTPDATLYKVQLLEYYFDEYEDEWTYRAVWTGYVTPDSWQENLDYRTAITITARDNVGHLKDFPFDMTPNADGLVKISDLIDQAMQTIDLAMDYTIAREGLGPTSLNSIRADGVDLHDAYINAELFKDTDWYSALEQTLEALGMALRYVGRNDIEITYLRNVPYMASPYASSGYQVLEFYGGTLEMDPAVKKIEEEQDYKQQSEVGFEILAGLTFNATTTYRCKTDGNTLPGGGTVSIPEHDADMNEVASRGQTGWDIGSGMLDPSGYLPDDFLKRAEGEDGWKNYAFIASNQVLNGSAPMATYRFKTRTSAVKLTFRFTPNPGTIEDNGYSAGKMKGDAHYSLSCIKYYVMYTDGTTTRFWNGGSWNNTAYLFTKDFDAQNKYETDLEIEIGECEDISSGTLVIEFGQIVYKMWVSGGHGCYARLAEMKAEINGTTALKSNRVTTVNDSKCNVLITRRPLFGALSKEMGFVKPANYLAGLFYYPSGETTPKQYPYLAQFVGQISGDIPIPVLIHEQILCFRHGAMRVLSGNCAPVNKEMFDLSGHFRYKGNTRYLLQGGTLDLFSGIMNGAVFHEFDMFDELWWNSTPTYDEKTEYNR